MQQKNTYLYSFLIRFKLDFNSYKDMASSLFGKLQFIYLAGISLTFIVFIFSYNDLKIIDVNVNVIDLSKPLQPESVYENVSCRKSAKYIVETTLCVNDYRTDYVSRIIWSEGVFENNILGNFQFKSRSKKKNFVFK